MADYSINAVTRKIVYSGSAGLGPYSFSFEILVNTDVAVYFNTTLLTLTTDYTVTINANGTGSVTIVTGTNVPTTPDGDDTITIVGARDIERTTDFSVGGDLSAAAINEQLDANIIFAQQIDERVDRSIKAAVTDPTSINMDLPVIATRANKLLAFDASGDVTVSTETVTQIEGAATSAAAAAASAAAAAASETAAGVSETNAVASYDAFDDRYLGSKASDPTLDNDGDALIDGALYWNTTNNNMYVYDLGGTAWVAALSANDFVSKTSGTGSAGIPVGTTAERDGSPATGYFRYNSTENQFEGYDGSAWGQIGGGAGYFKGDNGTVGSSAGDIFRINEAELNANVTIAATENASATGPVGVASGVTLTVDGVLVII